MPAEQHLVRGFRPVAYAEGLRGGVGARDPLGRHAGQGGKVGLEQAEHRGEAGEIVAAGVLVRPADEPVAEDGKVGGHGNGIAETRKCGSAE